MRVDLHRNENDFSVKKKTGPNACAIYGRKADSRPRNHSRELVSASEFIGPNIRREYWCSSQEAESRKISISFKNLFVNQC